MAQIYKIKDEYNVGNAVTQVTPYIYNLSGSVGEGGANQKMDVMLVQNLLNILYAGKSLNPDGRCGPKTIALIKDFQATLKSRKDGKFIKTDNRFDPIHNHGTFTPSQSFIYGIFFLNAIARVKDWRKYLGVIAHVRLSSSENLTNEFIDYYANINMPVYAPFCQMKDSFK